MINKPYKILIMGLPGAGKSYLAERLSPIINAKWLNADEVRKEANDWDFSPEGRLRQAKRMKDLSQKAIEDALRDANNGEYIVEAKITIKDIGMEHTVSGTIKNGD